MHKVFAKIRSESIVAAAHPTNQILYIFWYGGHGEIYGNSVTTQVVTNDSDAKKRHFYFEQELAIIACNKNIFIIAFLDCCRKQVDSDCDDKLMILELYKKGLQKSFEASY